MCSVCDRRWSFAPHFLDSLHSSITDHTCHSRNMSRCGSRHLVIQGDTRRRSHLVLASQALVLRSALAQPVATIEYSGYIAVSRLLLVRSTSESIQVGSRCCFIALVCVLDPCKYLHGCCGILPAQAEKSCRRPDRD